jgi:hypothetical protein
MPDFNRLLHQKAGHTNLNIFEMQGIITFLFSNGNNNVSEKLISHSQVIVIIAFILPHN